MTESPASIACALSLDDEATASCITASSVPTLGALYPMTTEHRVDPLTGRTRVAALNIGGASDDGTFARPLIIKRNPMQNIFMSFQDDDTGVNEWEIRGHSSASLQFWAGFDRRVTFLQNGDVGIGTGTPSSRLDVVAPDFAVPLGDGFDGAEFRGGHGDGSDRVSGGDGGCGALAQGGTGVSGGEGLVGLWR